MSPHPSPEPVTSDTDLTRRWVEVLSLVGGPSDSRTRTLWLTIYQADAVQLPALIPVEGVPEAPDPGDVQGLARMCAQVITDQLGGSGSVALALERPGPAHASPTDRAWERELSRAMTDAGVVMRRFHVAGDGWVLPLGRGPAFPQRYDDERDTA